MVVSICVGVWAIYKWVHPQVPASYSNGFVCVKETGLLCSGPGCCWKIVGDFAGTCYVSDHTGPRYRSVYLQVELYSLFPNLFVFLTSHSEAMALKRLMKGWDILSTCVRVRSETTVAPPLLLLFRAGNLYCAACITLLVTGGTSTRLPCCFYGV